MQQTTHIQDRIREIIPTIPNIAQLTITDQNTNLIATETFNAKTFATSTTRLTDEIWNDGNPRYRAFFSGNMGGA